MISAMSYGALSAYAVEALSIGAKEAGILINTGEGGLPEIPPSGRIRPYFSIWHREVWIAPSRRQPR
ncbi:MAG: hypothetical protein CMI16_04645 [Opitutaceae bacterium]|nr:hypothetical protein [Opitutaceae bacterium]